jgi:NADPH-dependent ferric siderophore reductase
MSSRRHRNTTVLQKKMLTKNMIRITLGGEDLVDFPEGQESGYIKLLLPVDNHAANESIQHVKRSYTVRAFDVKKHELTLDFVAHGESGPASAWAIRSQVGDTITIDGPGAVKLMDASADWFFMAGDMTALPAMSVNLEKLPAHAIGYAVIEVMSEEDKQVIDMPVGMTLHWVLNAAPDKENTCLLDAVKQLPWQDGIVNVWVASEFDAMRHLRHYFKQECHVPRGQIYASSYWKMGETDEGNKAAKKRDAEVA